MSTPNFSGAWCRALAVALAVPASAPGCGATPPSTPPAWQTIYEGSELGGAVLSVWGTGPDDVYVVGGPLGNGGAAVVQHYDGSTWTRLDPGGEDSFWWVSGSDPTDVWMVGEKGRMAHWDGATFEEYPRVTTATIWGVWAASPTDAWAVGGSPGKGTALPNDLVLHWDGKDWKPDPLPGTPLGRSLNKIWGTSSEDLYAVGEAATVWHRKGTTWKLESDPPVASSNLLTVFGCSATDVYAVGGQDVIHSSGAGVWSTVAVDLSNAVNGVTCGAPGEVLIVGFGGLKQRLVGGKWTDEFDVAPTGDIHSAWSDNAGSFWVAGGDFLSKPAAGKLRKALVGRYGEGSIGAIPP
jgi:hypothetical protein